jgi:histidyl-tRNA synthetase
LSFLAGLELDEATRERAAMNPLRVLDDKRPELQSQLAEAPHMVDHLCDDCDAHYVAVRQSLGILGVRWTEAPALVRGLDYYTRTTFEFTHDLLGAQSGIGGGGRYDGLMESIGGAALSGIGWGIGTDRTLLACEAEGLDVGAGPLVDVFCVPIGEQAKVRLVGLAGELRARGVRSDIAYGDRGLKGAMKAADRSGAPFVIVLGDNEVQSHTAVMKDMATGEQSTISWDSVPDVVQARVQEQASERNAR